MSRAKNNNNVETGMRLQTVRMNLGISQSDMAEVLEISDEQYRKIESGSSGLTVEKVRILYEKLSIDPSYLLVGKNSEDFDLDKYLVNCSKEQRDNLFRHCLAYIENYITR